MSARRYCDPSCLLVGSFSCSFIGLLTSQLRGNGDAAYSVVLLYYSQVQKEETVSETSP